MAINKITAEYMSWSPIWDKTRDGIGGQEVIKAKREKYLPKLGGQDAYGYDAYLKRANYINFSNRILNISIAQLFRKSPKVNFEDYEYVEEISNDLDLSGSSLTNWSKELFREILLINRVGVLVDYNKAFERPYLTMYKTENIINWRYITDPNTNLRKLSMVVIQGEVECEDPEDRYNMLYKKSWRELYLDDNGIYQYRDWVELEPNVFVYTDGLTPLKNGKPLNYIPFYFITNNGITDKILRAPLLDIINVNLSYYINNADYESMIHWTGAKTVITKMWNTGNNDKPFPIGGCADFNSPEGDAKFLECNSDSALFLELKHKEEVMAMLGTALLSGVGRYVASAETSRITSEGEYATLADISTTISNAMSIILKEMTSWLYNEEDANTISIEYNKDFTTNELDSTTLLSWITAVEKKMMSRETFYYNMKNKEMYPDNWDINKEHEAIEEDDSESEIDIKTEQNPKNSQENSIEYENITE